MSLTLEEARDYAERLIQIHNDMYEYSDVFEDEELQDLDEDDWLAVHALMHEATITISWEDDA